MPFDRRELIQGDPAVGLRVALQSFQQTVWTALPAIVTQYDPAKMTISAQPTVQAYVSDAQGNKTWTNLPICQDVPIMFPNAGGFALTFPIHVGDEVLLIFASRCIDAWWQNGGVGVQAEFRMHDLSDGFAMPGPRSQARLVPNLSENSVELRTEDGSSYVSVTDSGEVRVIAATKVTIDAAAEVEVTANTVTVNAVNVNIFASTSIVLTSPEVTINGNLQVNGDIGASGEGNIVGELMANNIKVSEHDHGGIRRGSERTDPPHNLP